MALTEAERIAILATRKTRVATAEQKAACLTDFLNGGESSETNVEIQFPKAKSEKQHKSLATSLRSFARENGLPVYATYSNVHGIVLVLMDEDE